MAKRKPRYDRIFIALAVLILCLIFLISGFSRCSQNKDDQNVPDHSGDVTISTEIHPADDQKNYPVIAIETDKIHSGHLLLANKAFPYSSDEESVKNGTSSDIQFVTIKSILDKKPSEIKPYTASDWEVGLDKAAALAMDSWFEAFCQLTGNHDLRMIGGYKPDSTDHDLHTGRTLTIGIFPETGSSYAYEPQGEYAWLAEHAAEYGFILRYPEDKDEYFDEEITERRSATYRYVGSAAAAYIYSRNICLEEFLQEIRQYSVGNMLKITSGEKTYSMYFVPADMNSKTTSVSIPSSSAAYDISGNNVDGFIITIYS